MDDYFRKALTWAQSRASAVETPHLGLVQNALTHLHGAVSKRDFACALARGFGANMVPEHREELAAEVGRWTGESSLLVPAMDIREMLRWAAVFACRTAGTYCFSSQELACGWATELHACAPAHAAFCPVYACQAHMPTRAATSPTLKSQACILQFKRILAVLQAAGHEQRVCSSP